MRIIPKFQRFRTRDDKPGWGFVWLKIRVLKFSKYKFNNQFHYPYYVCEWGMAGGEGISLFWAFYYMFKAIKFRRQYVKEGIIKK